ncbi:extracellular solute-binding protein [Aurantimonas sp. Leaf443]|uniref:extracellular solute-binding protein n=1 Tax=Aurantimonas sp. Leaf443 TaxID=1736378 RepID=UPI000B338494|nr:extracellular solute-binding protein [Aurantimonas sp. Leaf443]
MVIVTYPGALSAPHRWLADQIEARHPGLSIRLVPSDSQDIVAQIKAAQGYSPYDAGPNDEPPHLIGIAEGYLARRDDAAIPNLANAYPELVEKGGGFGVPATYSLVGVAYNTDLVETPPQSWADLWRPEFRGKIGIARTSSNLGLATLAIAAKTHGGSERDLEIGWSKLRELEPRAARSPAALTQMLEREEIAICPLWNNNTASAAQKGLPIAFVKPEPGAVAIISFVSGFANSRYPELVAEWMNGILSPDYQARAAAAPFYFGPTVKGVDVPPEAAPYTPSSPEEVVALQTIDWPSIVPVRGELVERFDRTFAI